MNLQVFLLEVLLAGFFALACYKAQARSLDMRRQKALRLGDFFHLTNRMERLRRSRWQWFAMVLLLYVVRMQTGYSMKAEFIVAAELVIFLALPTAKEARAGEVCPRCN